MPVDTIITRWMQQGIPQLVRDCRLAGGAVGDFEARAERMGDRLTIGGGAAAGVVGLIAKNALDAAGNVELIDRAFTRSLGSADAAKAKIAEIRQFAKDAPQFNFIDSARGFQMLQQAGVKVGGIIPLMKAVAESTAAAGKDNEAYKGSLLAISQISLKKTLQGDELLQLSERGVPALRILQRELKLTDAQLANIGRLKLDSDTVIAALTHGLQKEFGGSMKAGADSLMGATAAFEDARDQLEASFGKTILPEATSFIRHVTGMTEAVNRFSDSHPRAANGALHIAGGAAAGTVILGQYLKLQQVLRTTAAAKSILESATRSDDLMERKKSATALIESRAIGGVGKAATATAGAKGVLGAATEAETAAAEAATLAGQKLTTIQKARIPVSKALSRGMRDLDKARAASAAAADVATAAVGTGKEVQTAKAAAAALAKVEAAEKRVATARAARAALKSAGTTASAAKAAEEEALAAERAAAAAAKNVSLLQKAKGLLQSSKALSAQKLITDKALFKLAGSQATQELIGTSTVRNLAGANVGSAVYGGALGVGAGLGMRSDLKTLGVSEGKADTAALAAGLSAAALAAFNPPAAALIAAAELLRAGVTHFYSAPMEKDAEEGDAGSKSAEETAKAQAGMTNRQKAEDTRQRWLAKQKEADEARVDKNVVGWKNPLHVARKEALQAEANRLHEEWKVKRAQGRKDAQLDPGTPGALLLQNKKQNDIDQQRNFRQMDRERGLTPAEIQASRSGKSLDEIRKDRVAPGKEPVRTPEKNLYTAEPVVTMSRNGATTVIFKPITLPARPADNHVRKVHTNTLTPSPSY